MLQCMLNTIKTCYLKLSNIHVYLLQSVNLDQVQQVHIIRRIFLFFKFEGYKKKLLLVINI